MADRIQIDSRIRELVAEHGSLRAVARALDIDLAYLHRLQSGSATQPSDAVLGKLGLQRVSYYTSKEASRG